MVRCLPNQFFIGQAQFFSGDVGGKTNDQFTHTSKATSTVRDECNEIELLVDKNIENSKNQEQNHVRFNLNYSNFVTALENKTL